MSKTAMSLFIKWCDDHEILYPAGTNIPSTLRLAKRKANELLEIEKSQIKDAFECGQNEEGVYMACPDHKRQNGNDFYNETYPQP